MFNDTKNIGGFVKGAIAELLFQMMIREDENRTFTIIPFGYEKTTPELAQYQDLLNNHETLTVIKQSPDFILIKNDKTEVYFVEVKYRRHMSAFVRRDLFNRAKNIIQHWKDTWFFIATQDGFYFDSGKELVKNSGAMSCLDEKIISPAIQRKYLDVLKDFIFVKDEKYLKM